VSVVTLTGDETVPQLRLCRLSEKEADPRDKLGPSVSYLQRLGPEHIDQTFKYSRWIFQQDSDIAFEVRLLYRVSLIAYA